MSAGLFALLDAISKAAATSLDDVAAGAVKASVKSAGVVIDDAAVTPQYIQGVSPARELPVVKKIAKGSLINKFLFIIPIAMIMTWLAPWALPILLIIGGTYLCFEGAEKVGHWIGWTKEHKKEENFSDLIESNDEKALEKLAEREKKLISSAVRTDLVLSTEIMLIALSNIDATNWIMRLVILIVVALFMTIAVYGAVGLLIKMDDIGLYMATKKKKLISNTGKSIVKIMPSVFKTIGIIGTVAMLWVGGHILIKSSSDLGFTVPMEIMHIITNSIHNLGSVAIWVVDTGISAIVGVLFGAIIVTIFTLISKLKKKEPLTSDDKPATV